MLGEMVIAGAGGDPGAGDRHGEGGGEESGESESVAHGECGFMPCGLVCS